MGRKLQSLVEMTAMIFLFTLMMSVACAQQETPEASQEDPFVMETVSGEVSGITSKSISIIYDRDYDTGMEYEILIPLDEKTSVKHKKALSEIKPGDLVSIEYEKPVEKNKKQPRAKIITFVQSGVDSSVLQSKGAPQP